MLTPPLVRACFARPIRQPQKLVQSAGQLEARCATDPLARSRVNRLGFFLIRETVGAVRDHVRVHERRYTSKILIGDRVARRPQLVHNFRNPQRVPHQHRI